MIHFSCPACGNAMSVADQHAGKTGTCTSCRDKVRIPRSTPPVVPVPAPAPEFALPPFVGLPVTGRLTAKRKRGGGLFGIVVAALIPTVVCAVGFGWLGWDLPRLTLVVQPPPEQQVERTSLVASAAPVQPRRPEPMPTELARREMPALSSSGVGTRSITAPYRSATDREMPADEPTATTAGTDSEADEETPMNEPATTPVAEAVLDDADEPVPSDQPKSKAKTKTKAKATGKNPLAKALSDSEEPEWSPLDFGSFVSSSEKGELSAVDKDQTSEGLSRLRELEYSARQLYREYQDLERQRSPLVARRDPLLQTCRVAMQQNATISEQIPKHERRIIQLNGQLQIADVNQRGSLEANIHQLRNEIAGGQARIASNRAGIESLMPQINSLNSLIQPLNEQITKLWSQLAEIRKQWLTIRQPIEKYARGDFELLRKVLDDWLLIDGLWPDAQICGALCAYETGDVEGAYGYLEKLIDLETNIYKPKKPWARTEALKGLVFMKMSGQTSKGKAALQRAVQFLDKKSDWETYFVLGRCYADRDQDAAKAKVNLENALKIKPNFPSAKLWLARVQTTATSEKVRDPEAAAKTLESLWKSSGERSWRMADWLSQAYRAAGKTDAAARMVATAVTLAPQEFHKTIQSERK